MLNYCMITEGRFIDTYLPLHLKRANDFVDRFVLVDDGTFPNDAVERLSKHTTKPIVILTRKWDNNHSKQRNVYVDYVRNNDVNGWCLVMDSDEFPSMALLSALRTLTQGQSDGYETPSFDIRIPHEYRIDPIAKLLFQLDDFKEGIAGNAVPPQEVRELTSSLGITNYVFTEQYDFVKLNLFKVTQNTHYEGDVHEALVGQTKITRTRYPYYHVKDMIEVHRDGSRNYVEGGSGVNLQEKNPHWVELLSVLGGRMNWHEFRDFYSAPLLIWLWNHVGDMGNPWSSETYDMYLWLLSKFIIPFRYEGTPHKLEVPNRPEIEDLYRKYLFREPDEPGLLSWSSAWYRLPITKIIDGFVNSVEYKMRKPTGRYVVWY